MVSDGAIANVDDGLDAADLYLRRALGTLIINQRAVPMPIKCATSKSKFTISINTSKARTILAGSVIAIPGGCDTVLTINNDMLKATPMKATTTPRRPMNRLTNRNQKEVTPILFK
jgi:riboflavin synthase alpha subunit